MSRTVVVFVTDEAYLPHYKSLAVNCHNQGQYRGDYLWVCSHLPSKEIDDLESRGFHTLEVEEQGFLAKFRIFDEQLNRWEQAFYLDADVLVQQPFQPLFDQLTAWPREKLSARFGCKIRKRILSSREEVPVFMGWQIWDEEWKEHTAIYERMAEQFPHVLSADKMWSTALLLWEPQSIPATTVQRLNELQQEYHVCNNPEKGGTDEQIIDLLMHEDMAQVGEKAWCFWGLDEENARVPSIARGWRGGEIPVALHYGRWYAPWIEKTPDMDAYSLPRLDKVCHEFYAENLAAFGTVFPKRSN